jgi:erythromycin esterase
MTDVSMGDDRAGLIEWLRARAQPIGSLDPEAPLEDLAPFGHAVGEAVVVGLGESVRGARTGSELYTVKHRILRLLVEWLGFRAMTLEDSEAVGEALDDHVRTGRGDPRSLLAEAWTPWRTEEFLDVIQWIRAFNATHPEDMVRIVGVDTEGDHPLAHNTLAWHERTGEKVLYWGGLAHTAGGKANVNSFPPDDRSPTTGRSDGSVLRDNLGSGYLSVGVTCHHGVDLPPPPPEFAEAVLGAAGLDQYALDIRPPQPEVARRWLAAPATTRVIGPHYDPANDAAYHMTGGSLTVWFDVVVHVREVTPVHPL